VPEAPCARVRPLELRDAAGLAALARALNAHQGDPIEHFTPAAILRDGFGATPLFNGIVAELDGELIGYALLLPAYETGWAAAGLYMSDLFVAEGTRGLGIGRALVAACAAQAKREGRAYLWWATRAWNGAAQDFYRRLGAFDEPLLAHVLSPEALESLADEGEQWLARGASDGQ